MDPVTTQVAQVAGATTLTASGPSGVFAIRGRTGQPVASAGRLRRFEPMPASFSADLSRLSIRSIGVGERDLWGLTFRRTGPGRKLSQYFAVRLNPRTGRAVGPLQAVGPPVSRSDVKVVVIGARGWVLFPELGVLLPAP